ncbi:hypothetical protein TNCV_4955841 [Trichonephila clavipes]|nr:hypothetical protein TNCV_4955841 [Trichonephila clavipes]
MASMRSMRVIVLRQGDLYNRVSYKSWKNAILTLRNGIRRRAVAEFHLSTGHDCLRNYLRRLRVVPSSVQL